MADATDRVSIELIDAGEHKDQVAVVLSKVKGLAMPPQQLVRSAPCTVAINVPRPIAEKLQGFLEKAGAMVILEGGAKDLFTEETLPFPAEEESPEAEEYERPPVPPEIPTHAAEGHAPATTSPGKLQQLLAKLPFLHRPAQPDESAQEPSAPAEAAPPRKKLSLAELRAFLKPKVSAKSDAVPTEPFWAKWLKPKAKAAPETAPRETTPAEAPASDAGAEKKIPDWLANPAVLIVMGFLLGAIVAGVWGRMSLHSLQNDYEIKVGQQTQSLQQIRQETETLKQKNETLEGQLATALKQLNAAPPAAGEAAAPGPGPQELIPAIEKIMNDHAQSLAAGYNAQKQAKCSQQLLLDGKSTFTYAQVVKKFDPEYTKRDVLRSNSFITPYLAELKIPFQEELKTGTTEDACNAAPLQQLSTPEHHEFGGYYGYWTIQYLYKDGKWGVNLTVLEKNRALYDSSFQKGSPDYAKFRIDLKLFPEFAAQLAQ